MRSLWRTQGGWSLNDSPRGESIFVTWSPKIYHEARGGAPIENRIRDRAKYSYLEQLYLITHKPQPKL